MHILFSILRIAGIVLLAVAGILLALLLLVLFVPLRYSGHVRREEAAPGVEGSLTVTWLFRALSVLVELHGRKPVIEIRALGRRIKSFGEDPGEKENDRDHAPHRKKARSSRKSRKTASSGKSEKAVSSGESKKTAASAQSEKDSSPGKEEQETLAGSTAKKTGAGDRAGRITTRLTDLVRQLCDTVISLMQKLPDLLLILQDLADDASERAEAAAEKVRKTRERIAPFLDTDSRNWYVRVLRRLKRMLRHFRFRKIEGYARYGIGSPDLTGLLTGLLYIMLPASSEKFDAQPLFTEKGFDCDVRFRGHIRACHLVRVVIVTLLDRQTWKMIRKIRKKGRK